MFNAKKSQVDGYNHNAPKFRDLAAGQAVKKSNAHNNPKIAGNKAFSNVVYKHNATQLVSPKSKRGKTSFGS